MLNKSKTVLATLGFAAATAFAGSALAQGQTQETGAYAGLSIGQTTADACNQITTLGTGASCDDKDMAWKIFGGYQFNRFIAAEGAYTDLGKVKLSGPGGSGEVKLNAWEIVAVGSYPIGTSGFAPYGKFGFYRGEVEATAPGFSAKETSNDWTAGLGVRYDITRNFAVRAEWQRYNGDVETDVLSIGALYKF